MRWRALPWLLVAGCNGAPETNTCNGETSVVLEVQTPEGVAAPKGIRVVVSGDDAPLYDQEMAVDQLPGTLVIYADESMSTLHVEITGTSEPSLGASLDVALEPGCQVHSVAMLWPAKPDPECAPACDEMGSCTEPPGPETPCGDACLACDGKGGCTATPVQKLDVCEPCDETGCVATISWCQSPGECQNVVGELDCCDLDDPSSEELLLCQRAGCNTAP